MAENGGIKVDAGKSLSSDGTFNDGTFGEKYREQKKLADTLPDCICRCVNVYQWYFYHHGDGWNGITVYYTGAKKMEVSASCDPVYDSGDRDGNDSDSVMKEERNVRRMV